MRVSLLWSVHSLDSKRVRVHCCISRPVIEQATPTVLHVMWAYHVGSRKQEGLAFRCLRQFVYLSSMCDSCCACRFALVGGPARQDAPRAIDALKKLNVPYLVSLPLVFQTTEEWMASELGVHPVQVALQVSLLFLLPSFFASTLGLSVAQQSPQV